MAAGNTIDYDNPDDMVNGRPSGPRVPGRVYPTGALNLDGTPQGPPSATKPLPPPGTPPTQTTTILPPDDNKYPGTGLSTKGVTPIGPSGIDPRLAAIYQKYGMTPGERGSGFADWQYWQDKPSQWQRLEYDLQGTGTDQPTGTPGQGAWQNSGRGQVGSGGGGGYGASPDPLLTLSRSNNPGIGFTTGSTGGDYHPIPSTQSMSSQDAIAYLNKMNHSIGGQDLTSAQIQEAAGLVGYKEGQPVTGDQLNTIVQEMYKRAGKTLPTGGPSGGPGTSTTGDPTDANSLFAYLMHRGNEGLNVDPNSPVVKNQTDAFRANEDRMGRNAMSAEAERAGSNANLTAYDRSQTEKGAQATSQFEGQAMAHEVDARRQEIQQALQLGTNLLTEQQRQSLQRELAQLDVASRQFMQYRDLQERGYEFDANDQFRNSPLYGG